MNTTASDASAADESKNTQKDKEADMQEDKEAICDENLIDNVVQGSYQKRDNAGNGIHPHQFPYRFFFEKFIGMFQATGKARKK